MRHLLLILASLAALAAAEEGGMPLDEPSLRRAGPPMVTGPDITFENRGLRLVIGPGGECKSLYDKTLVAERNCQPGRPLMCAVVDNRTLPATSCARQGNLLNVTFGEHKARAVIEVQTHPYFLGIVIRSSGCPRDWELLT